MPGIWASLGLQSSVSCPVNGILSKGFGPRSSDRPLYAFITSAIGERPQYNLLKINILNFSGILPYALISH